MLAGLKGVAWSRRALLAGVGVAALAFSACTGTSAPGAAELARVLGQESASVVRPEDLRWEPSGGTFSDLLVGRFVLFLGSVEADGPRDVYRARVRLSPEGRPLSIGNVYNLTSTPLGDDHALVVSGQRAAFATWSYGKEQSVTVLDLSGEGTQGAALVKASDRLLGKITNLQATGSSAGVARHDVTFAEPPVRVGLALGDTELVIDAADEASVHHGRLDLATGEVSGDGMHADAGKHLPKRLVHWAVDTVRAVSWIGPAPIAWLEEKTFAAKDTIKKTLFKATKSGDELVQEPATPVATVLDTSQASLDTGHWPPATIKSMWKTPDPGEGEWTTPKQDWVKTLPVAANGEKPPSPFYETFVRPDEDRPYAKVILVAMDMRQLDVGMEAGSEDPKPLTGPPGTGRIPRDPQIYQRVAAAFNGGFKTEHGNYGMMLNKRVLLPPQPGAATVILTKEGKVGMGSWGAKPVVGGINGVETADILSYRQNLDPLVDQDKVNPSNRGQWGFVLPGTSMQTERSGICVNAAGHMMYAWGDDTSATSLGKAMKMAGCIYGMHLDMNPHHTGFMYTNITEFKGRNYKSQLITTQMEIDTDRYLLYAPKDFFFMMLHDPKPQLEGEWEPDQGTQPAPSWMAGLWRGKAGSVELLDIEPGRASFRARAGTKDVSHRDEPRRRHKRDDDDDDRPTPKAAPPAPPKGTELSDEDAHRVLFALSLGVSGERHPRGLVADGQVVIPPSGEGAMLSVAEDGALTIGKEAGTGGDAVELPLVLDDGASVPHASATAPVVLGTAPGGRVVVGRNGSIDEIVAALKKAGCTKAVLLDRGAGNHGAIFRAGTATPPRSHYEETTLYAMGKPLLPRGFRFEATQPLEPPKKK